MPVDPSKTVEIGAALAALPWGRRLSALQAFAGLRAVFSTSFGYEDQVLTHIIARENLPIGIFTLDTGRLFAETADLARRTADVYKIAIETFHPDEKSIEAYVRDNGLDGFYNSVESRKACCHIRKIEALPRALQKADVWISGLRREQSETRGGLDLAEWDPVHGLIKIYPLYDVGADELWNFIREHRVPYNPLHDQGFPSIGCAPCTRAVKTGEHPRAGRWWWEQGAAQECGLHVVDGKLVRGSPETPVKTEVNGHA